MTMSGAARGSGRGAISTFTLTSYTLLPMRMRTRRLVGVGMTTTFVSMTLQERRWDEAHLLVIYMDGQRFAKGGLV